MMKVQTFSGEILCTVPDGSTDEEIVAAVPDSYLGEKSQDFVFVQRSEDPSVIQIGMYSFSKLLETKPKTIFGCEMIYTRLRGVRILDVQPSAEYPELEQLLKTNGWHLLQSIQKQNKYYYEWTKLDKPSSPHPNMIKIRP